MGVFPAAWLNELMSKSDIVALASEYTVLKPKGRRLWGCCPFHSEKTPSFSVTPENQMYYCFGCHAGGGVVQFVMEMERLTYVEAIRYLAQRAGMELPNEVDDDRLRRDRALKEKLYAVCRDAALYYHGRLLGPEGARARQYLERRGIGDSMIRTFGLGYAPEGWDGLISCLSGRGCSRETLIAAGLAVSGKNDGSCYDAYRDRVIFPIVSTARRVLGFGARTMGNGLPKYINTGDTPIFSKRSNLYAINLQRGKRPSDIIIVEGYMDVISLYKAGITNAVASLGTALTNQQARLLKRYVSRVYISYDGDAAGQSATLRGLDILSREGLDVRVIVIPDGLDPDDFVRQRGAEEYLSLKDKALALNAFKLDSLMRDIDMDTPDGREEYAKKACRLLGALQPVEQERYAAVVSRRTGLSEAAIMRQCGLGGGVEGNSIGNNRNTKQKTRVQAPAVNKAEIALLSCVMRSGDALFAAMEEMAKNDLSFSLAPLNDFVQKLLADRVSGVKSDMALMMADLPGDAADMVSAAATAGENLVDPVATARDCVNVLAREKLDKLINELAASLQAGGSEADRIEYVKLVKKRASLK